MIIIGVPRSDEIENYYMAEGSEILELERAGFHAKFMDGTIQYFKLNNKLKKFLEQSN